MRGRVDTAESTSDDSLSRGNEYGTGSISRHTRVQSCAGCGPEISRRSVPLRDWDSLYATLLTDYRPTWHEYGLTAAIAAASRSTCTRAQNGAVVFRDNRQLVTGYNGALAGQPHCTHPDSQPCKVAVHAEANAVYSAAREGIRLAGGIIYCTMSPCKQCAQAIIQSGITTVHYLKRYRDATGIDTLRASGVDVFGWLD